MMGAPVIVYANFLGASSTVLGIIADAAYDLLPRVADPEYRSHCLHAVRLRLTRARTC